MLERYSTNATMAKARTMYGKRLKPEDYKELMHRGSVAEVAEYLKRNTYFREILAPVDTNTVHRGYLEELLRKDSFSRYEELCSFQGLDKIPFYNYEIRRQETDLILSSVLHLNAGDSEELISSLPGYLQKHASFDLFQLAHARSYADILKTLEKTTYGKILESVQPDADGLYNCTRIENLLQQEYLRWLFETIQTCFSKEIAQELRKIILIQTDLMNLLNGFRIKAFHEAGSSVLEEDGVLPFRLKITKAQYGSLAEAPSVDSYLHVFGQTYYGRQVAQLQEQTTAQNLQKGVQMLRYKYNKMRLRSAQSVPVSLYTILYLFRVEIDNIIKIIEGIRYQVPLSYMENLIIT